MTDNKGLHNAKAQKFDEYFTEYSSISDELPHYRDHFEGQIVYCNCDDPVWSNFWKYFHSNFTSLGLKKLVSTHYRKDMESSYAMIYEGGDDFNLNAGKTVEIHGNTSVVNGKEVFFTAGDFRSDACIRYLEEATIVVTNPPFSLFREYMAQLLEFNKKFIIIGNMNAITYKEIFPLIKNNQIWTGYKRFGGGMDMIVPDTVFDAFKVKNYRIDSNGRHIVNVMGVIWYTNIETSKRHDGLWHRNGVFDNSQAHCYYEGNENAYQSYDNYDAINVDKTKDIPVDYPGVMGVPITWLDKYSPYEFEIIGLTASWDESDEMNISKTSPKKRHNPILNNREVYRRVIVRNLHPIKKADDLGY